MSLTYSHSQWFHRNQYKLDDASPNIANTLAQVHVHMDECENNFASKYKRVLEFKNVF